MKFQTDGRFFVKLWFGRFFSDSKYIRVGTLASLPLNEILKFTSFPANYQDDGDGRLTAHFSNLRYPNTS